MDAESLRAWYTRLRTTADLEAAYRELEGDPSFLAESLRGRIAMLSADWRRAAQHLRAASERLRAGENCAVHHAFLHHAYCREASLIAGRRKAPSVLAPIPHALSPQMRSVMATHRLIDAAEFVAAGQSRKAERTLHQLLGRGDNSDYTLAFLHLGLCACAANLGRAASAIHHLEVAGLHGMALDDVLGKARLAPRLMVLYREFGRAEESESWRLTLESLPCPEATKASMIRRAELIAKRFRKAGVMLMV